MAFILTVTAIKDGIEDYRRAVLDEEVNNSAATKLGDWRNVNQPKDPRSWFERALGLNPPGKVTRGVKKLRAKEAEKSGKKYRKQAKKRADKAKKRAQKTAKKAGK